jgi:hypothetical protein
MNKLSTQSKDKLLMVGTAALAILVLLEYLRRRQYLNLPGPTPPAA